MERVSLLQVTNQYLFESSLVKMLTYLVPDSILFLKKKYLWRGEKLINISTIVLIAHTKYIKFIIFHII